MPLLLLLQSLLLPLAFAGEPFDKACLDSGGTPEGIACECNITHWTINPFNSKCPEKEIMQGAQGLPGTALGQAPDCLPTGAVAPPKDAPDLDRCPAFKRDEKLRSLPENWALEFSGAQLLRDHPGVKAGDYANTRVGVVDTGLAVKGNPAAGAQMQADSPELDIGSHGTHVAGIVASQDHGVNPLLRVRSFSTANIGGSFENSALMNSFAQAIDDPQTKVINLSIGSASVSPALSKLLGEAHAKGKWVVLAGGNEKSVNGNKMLGLEKTAPNLFVIGSMSYFAAPSEFSNFGPETDYYSPGSAIESLYSGYARSPKDQKPTIHYGGTSMATPHFAAVLATMRALHPALDLGTARYILSKTAIQRGSVPDKRIKQANDYHAVHLLWSAKACLEKNAIPAKACLDQADEQIQGTLREPQLPSASDCASWEKYYNELKRNYFLSNGSATYAKLIQSVLAARKDPSWASKVYLAPVDQVGPSMKGYRVPGTADSMKKEALSALDFYFPTEKPKALTELGTMLSQLEGKPENAAAFLGHCRDYLTGDLPPESMPEKARLNRIIDVKESCDNYISVAPSPFLKALVDRIRAEKIAVSDDHAQTHLIVACMQRLSGGDQKKAIAIRDELHHDFASIILSNDQLKHTPNSYGQTLQTARGYLSIREKVEFSKKYAAIRSRQKCKQRNDQGEEVEGLCTYDGYLLGYVPGTFFSSEEEKRLFLERVDRRPAVAKAAYAFDQANAGLIGKEEPLRLLDELLKNPPGEPAPKKGRFYEMPPMNDDALSSRLALFAETPDGAAELAKRLVQGDNLVRLAKFNAATPLAQTLIEQVQDGALRAKLIQVALTSKAAYSNTKSISMGADDPVQIALGSDTPEAKAKIDELLKNEQRDPWLEKVRLRMLLKNFHDKAPTADEIRSFLKEAKKHSFPVRADDFETDTLASSPELLQLMETELRTSKDERQLDHYWAQVRFARPAAYAKMLPILIRNMGRSVVRPYAGGYSWVIESLPEHDLPDPKLIEQAISTIAAHVKTDAKSLERLGPDAGDMVEAFGRALDALSRLQAGRDYMETHPAAYEAWAELIRQDRVSTDSRSEQFGKPSPKLLQILRRKSKEPTPGPIANYLYSRDPESLDEALSAYRKLPDPRGDDDRSREARQKRDLRESITALVRKHPELARKVVDSTNADNALRSDVLDLSASQVPQRKEIF